MVNHLYNGGYVFYIGENGGFVRRNTLSIKRLELLMDYLKFEKLKKKSD